jgi:hypothetical protein
VRPRGRPPNLCSFHESPGVRQAAPSRDLAAASRRGAAERETAHSWSPEDDAEAARVRAATSRHWINETNEASGASQVALCLSRPLQRRLASRVELSAQRGCSSSTATMPDATAKGGLLTGEGADVS